MAAADAFATFQSGLAAPYVDAAAVTPSDGTDLTNTTRGLFIGGAGNVTVIMANGETVTFTAPVVGTILPIRVTRVKATGTTATAIVALW